jgi:hypothetical protein
MSIYSKEDLMQDPSTVFKTPSDVLDNPDLSAQQKVVVLRQWHNDVLQRLVAEEENMAGDPGNAERLRQIANALGELGENP